MRHDTLFTAQGVGCRECAVANCLACDYPLHLPLLNGINPSSEERRLKH